LSGRAAALRQQVLGARRSGPAAALRHLWRRWQRLRWSASLLTTLRSFVALFRTPTATTWQRPARLEQGEKPAGQQISVLFRADALEARQEIWLGRVRASQPLPVHLVARSAAAMLLCFLAIAIFGTYTRRVNAQGVLLPEAGLIAVTAQAAGRIAGLAAHEGEAVRRGQLLYVIDLDAVSAGGPTRQGVIAALQQQLAALRRERALRIAIAGTDKQALAVQLDNFSAQHAELARQLAVEDAALPVLKAKAEQYAASAAKGVIPYATYQSQNVIYMQQLAEHARGRQNFLAVAGKIAQIGSDLASADDRLAETLAGLDRSIHQLDQQITENEGRARIEVQAPQDGVLTGQRVHLGQSVPAGSTLVTLLPNAGALEAHLYVDSTAIGFVAEGAPVMLRYAAFPYQRFGLHAGAVTEVTRAPISASGLQAELGGASEGRAPQPGEAGRYRVVVRPARQAIEAGGQSLRLEAGMRVTADIALDRRALYQWALDPIHRLRQSVRIVTGAGP
jgi:membrane fusion protein